MKQILLCSKYLRPTTITDKLQIRTWFSFRLRELGWQFSVQGSKVSKDKLLTIGHFMVLSAVENITERRYLLSLIWQWWQQPLVTYPEAMRWSPTKFYTGDEVKQLTTLLLSISLALCFIRCFVSLIFLSMTSLCSLSSGLSISTYCFICPNTTFSLCPSEITSSMQQWAQQSFSKVPPHQVLGHTQVPVVKSRL